MQKLLPPILFILFIITMSVICWGTGSPHQLTNPYNLIGVPMITLGLLLSMSGKRLFNKLNVNVMTFDEPSELVTQGVYRYSRNPMYLGFVIALVGFSIILGAAISSLLLAFLFIVIVDKWYIAYEEKKMRNKFGKAYDEYCRNVRRWI